MPRRHICINKRKKNKSNTTGEEPSESQALFSLPKNRKGKSNTEETTEKRQPEEKKNESHYQNRKQ